MSEKAFEAEIVNVADLLQRRNIFFEVPEFQRPYSWDDEQIEQFWDDIYSAWKDGRRSYFFGPMIFAKREESLGYKYVIIDGQQRLTTLLILLCVVRDLFLESKNKSFDSMFNERITACISYFGRFKLKLQPEHHSKFENTILKGIEFPEIKRRSNLLKLRQENRYLYVANFFKEKLLELYKSDRPKAVKEFIEYVLDNVEIVEIRTKELPEAIRIFQVVNTRGLDLSPADIIKANLYSETPEDRKREFKSLWQRIEEAATEQNRSLTALFTYYVYYHLAPNRPKRATQDVMNDIFEKYRKAGYTTTNLLYDVKDFVESINFIENLQNNTIITMKYLPNETYWLTILASAKKENYKDFKELVGEIRRLFYLYWIAGYTSQKIRQLSLNVINMIKSRKTIDDIKKTIEDKLEEDDVYRLVVENLNGDVYGQRWLKPLLLIIEYEHSEPVKTVYVDLKRVHIEHVLPQKWKDNEYWKASWTENEARKWLNRLGNLTLLYSKINEKIRNASFIEKQDYYKGLKEEAPTSFIITRKLFEFNDWTPEEVAERHKWMIREVSRILNIPTKHLKF